MMKLVAVADGSWCQACTVNKVAAYKLVTDEDMVIAWLCEHCAGEVVAVELPKPRWRLNRGYDGRLYEIVDANSRQLGLSFALGDPDQGGAGLGGRFSSRRWFPYAVAEKLLEAVLMMEDQS